MIRKIFQEKASEAQAGRPQISNMESYVTIVNGQKLLTIVTKRSIFMKVLPTPLGVNQRDFLIDRFPISLISFWDFSRTLKKAT